MTLHVRRNLARTAGLALVALSLLLFGYAGSAGADGPTATLKAQGWWSQLPSAIAAPGTGKGQLVVQGNPKDKNGTTYSAVRYAVGTGNTVTGLTLKVGADQGGSSAVLLACQTGSAWSPVDGGEYSAAPKVTDKCVNGQRAADGASWTFAVGPIQTGDIVDVAIVPGVDSTTKAPSTFSLTFDQPSNDSLATAPGSSSSSAGTNYTPSTFATGGSPAGSGAVASKPSGVTPRPPAVPTGIPAIPTDKQGETATSPAKQASSQPGLNSTLNTSPASSSKPNKTAGYIVLAFAALVGLYAYRQDNLMARNGGVLPGAAEEVGGLGRFTKPRTGQPPALT